MNKIKSFFDREQNLLVHIIAAILVTIFGFIFKISLLEWLLIYSMIALVITSELINSSIELVVNLYTTEFNPLAMIAKDVASSGVLVSAITALLVGLYIFIPKVLELIF